MSKQTTEFIIHVLVTTPGGDQEPEGFMIRTYYPKNAKIEKVTCDIKSQVEKLQTEFL